MNDLQKKILEKNFIIPMILFPLFIFLIILGFTFTKNLKINMTKKKLEYLTVLSKTSVNKRKNVAQFINKKVNFNKNFIEENLENYFFLKNEYDFISKITKHIFFKNTLGIRDRENFLISDKNKLKFFEENLTSTKLITESILNQMNPVEVDERDVEKILSIVEEKEINDFKILENSPQLIFKNFSLKKDKKEIFTLNMNILKREFYKKDEE
ncbi:MAG: hypothetical protein A3F40_01180 [Chlamydiae bacterium RIFCSPHIGHO2_12_FULL_27_8]|nr:MAG: hypothetical protein A3F40_01180 [Chlamydiae bacterium RIFCSPHIGHO2_12_FULL_27_8]